MSLKSRFTAGCATISVIAAGTVAITAVALQPQPAEMGLIAVAAGTVAILLAMAYSMWLTRPLDRLMAGVQEIERDNFNHQIRLDGNGEFSRISRTLNTMTKVTQRAQELELKSHKAAKFAELGWLASGVGHELKNPINVALNSVFYLKEALKDNAVAKEDPAVREMLDLAEKELRGMANVISDLLSFSRTVKLNPQPSDLHQLLKEARCRVDVPDNVKVEERFSGELPKVSVDPLKITQVFLNLASNAIQAMPEGGTLSISTRLDKGAWQGQGSVLIEFKDTGVGIPSEKLGKIYEPVFTAKGKGAGMGLVLSNRVVVAHDGSMDVDSTVGKGSTFTIRLPLSGRPSSGLAVGEKV